MNSQTLSRFTFCFSAFVLFCLVATGNAETQDADTAPTQAATQDPELATESAPNSDEVLDEVRSADKERKEKPPSLPELKKPWIRIGRGHDKVWINQELKQVAIDGEVCLTKGYLEMFACILGTKEHESVIALRSKAFIIHTGLLAVGAEPGSPAQWRPNYRPAHGTKIGAEVEWQDENGEMRRTKAQEWIRDLKTKKAMEHDWVFAGSLFWVDPETKKKYYRADGGGEVLCVSNFPVAMMDLPIQSSQANDELAFEVLTENVPKRRSPIRLYLIPELPKKEDSTTPKEN